MLDSLLTALKEREPQRRVWALLVFGQLEDKSGERGATAVAEHLNDDNLSVKRAALDAIAKVRRCDKEQFSFH